MTIRDIEKKILDGKKLTEEDESFLLRKLETYRTEHPDVVYRHPRWKKILSWVAGYQNYDYNRLTGQLVPVKRQRQRRLIFNRLRAYVRTVLGKIKSTQVQLGVVPNSDDPDDINAARIADLVVEFFSHKFKFTRLRRLAFLWLILINQAYVRVYWDEDDEGIIGYEEGTGEPIVEPGDVRMEVVSPFNCRPDPLYSDPAKWRFFVYCEKVDAEALEEAYELEQGSLKEADDMEVFSTEGEGDVDFPSGGVSSNEAVVGRTVTRLEFWTKDIYVFAAGNTILEYGANPYGVIPFFKHEEQIIPIESYQKGIQYNDSLIKDLIAVQREYNRFISLFSTNLERAAKIKVLTPLDSVVNPKALFEDDSLALIGYNALRGQPHQLKLETIPEFMMSFKQELEREIESVGGVHEVSYGRLPERASHASGVLVNLLLEQDDQTLDMLIQDVDAMFSDAWKLVLKIVQTNYTTPRLLKVVGREQAEGIKYFEGADLRGNHDVIVTSNLGLPKSRALRIEWIMRLAQAGLIQDPKTILELLEFGQVKRVFADQLLHERKAQRENLRIEKDLTLTLNDVNNFLYQLDADDIHLKIHLRDRLSPKYEKYTDEQKEFLEMHIQAHLSRSQLAVQALQAGLQKGVRGQPRRAITQPELMPTEGLPTTSPAG